VTDSIEDQLPILEERTAVESRTDSMLAGARRRSAAGGAGETVPGVAETVILRDWKGWSTRDRRGFERARGHGEVEAEQGRAELVRILRRQKVCYEVQRSGSADLRLRRRRGADAERATVELHLNECESCRQVVADSRAALEFMERVAEVEVPPALVNKILFEVRAGGQRRCG